MPMSPHTEVKTSKLVSNAARTRWAERELTRWCHRNETCSVRSNDFSLSHGFPVHPKEWRVLSENLTKCSPT